MFGFETILARKIDARLGTMCICSLHNMHFSTYLFTVYTNKYFSINYFRKISVVLYISFMRVEEEVNDGHLLQLGTSSHDFQKKWQLSKCTFYLFYLIKRFQLNAQNPISCLGVAEVASAAAATRTVCTRMRVWLGLHWQTRCCRTTYVCECIFTHVVPPGGQVVHFSTKVFERQMALQVVFSSSSKYYYYEE